MRKLLILLAVLIFAHITGAQSASGIISSSRSITWTSAGFPGTALPDAAWTQCGSTIAAYGSSGTPASPATINSALAACGSNTYVLLGAGTFYLNGSIVVSQSSGRKSNLVLRGSGSNSTFLIFSGIGGTGGCYNSSISMEGDCVFVNGGEENVCNWTAGYAVGTTSVTLANCGTASPGFGSLSNLKVGNILIFDQLDEQTDPGTIWNCAQEGVCAGTIQGGGARVNGPCGSSFQGVWSSATAYTTGQSVSAGSTGTGGATYGAGGYTFIALQNNTNQTPTTFNVPVYWAACQRSQQQGVTVQTVNTTTGVVTFTPGLYMPNWRSGQQPQAYFATNNISNVGLENLSFNTSSSGDTSSVDILACEGCWVSGVRGQFANRSHVRFQFSAHSVLKNSYFFANQTGGSVSYGAEINDGWDNVIENNIFQQITDSDPSCTGSCSGNVIDYNFDVDNAYVTNYYIVPPFFQHAAGDSYNLWEGNIGPGYSADAIHGTHYFETAYRNVLPGWQSKCFGPTDCRSQTIPFQEFAGSRYFNFVGNVVGQGPTSAFPSGYHTTYQCNALTSNSYCASSYQVGGYDKMIYETGYYGAGYTPAVGFCTNAPTCSTFGTWDPQVTNYLMRWANYDVVTAAVRFCGSSSDTGWSTTCSSTSEIPTTLPSYSNSLPTLGDTTAGQSAMPASFYYATKPAFLGSIPWPVAGPDVTSGNLGNCSGGTYYGMAATSSAQCTGGTLATAWAGHANANAAMNCYLTTMGGVPDGTGSVLAFNASSCYAAGGPQVATPTFSPAGGPITSTVTVTISCATAGATITYTTDGSTPIPGSHGTVYTVPFQVSASQLVQAIGSLSGDTNSAVGQASYQLGPGPVPSMFAGTLKMSGGVQ